MSKLAKVALVLAVSMSGVSGSAWAINKCVDANGRTSFQDEPCASGQKAQEMVVTPSSRGINPSEGSKPSAHRPSSQTLYLLRLHKRGLQQNDPVIAPVCRRCRSCRWRLIPSHCRCPFATRSGRILRRSSSAAVRYKL